MRFRTFYYIHLLVKQTMRTWRRVSVVATHPYNHPRSQVSKIIEYAVGIYLVGCLRRIGSSYALQDVLLDTSTCETNNARIAQGLCCRHTALQPPVVTGKENPRIRCSDELSWEFLPHRIIVCASRRFTRYIYL